MLGSILTPLLIMCHSNCYDVHINIMFGSYLPPVVCRRLHVLFMIYVFVCGTFMYLTKMTDKIVMIYFDNVTVVYLCSR